MADETTGIFPGTTRVGTLGHATVFAWLVCLSVLAPAGRVALAAGLCLTVIVALYPAAPRRMLMSGGRLRIGWVLLLVAIFSGGLLIGSGEEEGHFPGLAISSEGFVTGVRMVLRALVVLLAVAGLSGCVDIAEMAGLLERVGLHGLGFSVGVAVNLLPSLSHSSLTAWQSLRMRGGFRARRWRGMRLLFVTVVGNALRRSQEIAIAAEARGFRSDQSRPMPLKRGSLDVWILVLGFLSGLVILLVP